MAEEELTEREMEVVMTVFKSYETGLREATIYPKVKFMKAVAEAAHKEFMKKLSLILESSAYSKYCRTFMQP